MATVTMTFVDTPHGTIEIDGDVDPPIQDDQERTPAQELGFRILQELYAIQESGRLQQMRFGGKPTKGSNDGTN